MTATRHAGTARGTAHCAGRWRGVISLGFGPDGKRVRRKVSGKTKSVIPDRLKRLHDELDSGVRTSPNYTVQRAAEDWLRERLTGRSPKTIKKNENVLAPILAAIGGRRLRELAAGDVQHALARMADKYSSAAVVMGHNALTRVIRHAEARDLIGRNVATLVDTPKGQVGRPSKSLTLVEASALLAVTEGTRMHAYISLCLATGIRTEEARELRWDHLDFVVRPPGRLCAPSPHASDACELNLDGTLRGPFASTNYPLVSFMGLSPSWVTRLGIFSASDDATSRSVMQNADPISPSTAGAAIPSAGSRPLAARQPSGSALRRRVVIEAILPSEVASAEAFADLPGVFLFPQEEAMVSRAVGKRRREFATARDCARTALASLGVAPVPVLAGERGAPLWPAWSRCPGSMPG